MLVYRNLKKTGIIFFLLAMLQRMQCGITNKQQQELWQSSSKSYLQKRRVEFVHVNDEDENEDEDEDEDEDKDKDEDKDEDG